MRSNRRWLAAGAALAVLAGGAAAVRAVVGDDSDGEDRAPAATRVLTRRDAEAASAQGSRQIRRELARDVRTASSGRDESVQAPSVPHHPRANLTSTPTRGGDGRYYFRTFRPGHDGADKFPQLWSFSPGSPDAARREGEAQQWTVNQSLLATLAYDSYADPVDLTIRDLATGMRHRRTFEDCGEPYLEASRTFVVVACHDEPDLLVLDDTATPLARLRVPPGSGSPVSGRPASTSGSAG